MLQNTAHVQPRNQLTCGVRIFAGGLVWPQMASSEHRALIVGSRRQRWRGTPVRARAVVVCQVPRGRPAVRLAQGGPARAAAAPARALALLVRRGAGPDRPRLARAQR